MAARLRFLLLACIVAPYTAYITHHDYGFTQGLHAAPRLLMTSPWLVTASLLARRTSRRTFGISQLIDLLHNLCRNGRAENVYAVSSVTLGLSSVFEELWRLCKPHSYSLEWTASPHDILLFAAVFFNQCAACFHVSLLYLRFLDIL